MFDVSLLYAILFGAYVLIHFFACHCLSQFVYFTVCSSYLVMLSARKMFLRLELISIHVRCMRGGGRETLELDSCIIYNFICVLFKLA